MKITQELHPLAHDLTGQRKGTFTVVGLSERRTRKSLYWLVRCDCGREKNIAAGNWRTATGTVKCLCTPVINYNQLPDGEASFNLLFSSYIRKAGQRRIVFALSREEFRSITQQDCVYCGKPPSQLRKTGTGTPYVYNGIDRVDSARGYVMDNVVSACRYCNQAKSDLTFDEWRAHIQLLWERLCR